MTNFCSSLQIGGLVYIPDFLAEHEMTELVCKIDSHPWALSQSGRRKQDFSPRVNFKRQRVKMDRFQGVPSYAKPLIDKMECHQDLSGYKILELCNLEYEASRASRIEFHRDDRWIWGERLISINLLEGAIMTLRGPVPAGKDGKMTSEHSSADANEPSDDDSSSRNANSQNGCQKNDTHKNPGSREPVRPTLVYIPMRVGSLLAMFGDVRHVWEHGIMPHHVARRRIALTMREPERKFMSGGELYEEYGKEMIRRSGCFISV